MSYFWCRFSDGTGGTVQAATVADAERIGAERRGGPVSVEGVLPYPARPIVAQSDDCPAFCYRPGQCLNRSACPQHYACSE